MSSSGLHLFHLKSNKQQNFQICKNTCAHLTIFQTWSKVSESDILTVPCIVYFMYLYWVDTVPPVVYLYSVHHRMSLYGSSLFNMIHVYIATMTLSVILNMHVSRG